MTELIELRRAGAPGTDRVIGIGMDCTEPNVDPLSFAPAYREAAAAGLRRTGHQGQNSPAAAIGVVAVGLGAERIDHGVTLIEDPDLVRFFADRRIPLTMCPTSNVVVASAYSSVDRHPLPALREAGVLVTVNTDDPALIDTGPGPRVRQLRGGVALVMGPDGRPRPGRRRGHLARRLRQARPVRPYPRGGRPSPPDRLTPRTDRRRARTAAVTVRQLS